jgi:hypothetical protein
MDHRHPNSRMNHHHERSQRQYSRVGKEVAIDCPCASITSRNATTLLDRSPS